MVDKYYYHQMEFLDTGIKNGGDLPPYHAEAEVRPFKASPSTVSNIAQTSKTANLAEEIARDATLTQLQVNDG